MAKSKKKRKVKDPKIVLEIKPTNSVSQYRVRHDKDGFFHLERLDRSGSVSHVGMFVGSQYAEAHAVKLIEAEAEAEARDG